MKNKNQIKHVIDSMALVPVPAHFVFDVFKAEIPFFRRYNFGKKKFSLPRRKLLENENGYDGVELTLWGLFDENWQKINERIEKLKNSNIKFCTFHGCFEGCPKTLKGYYLNLAEKNEYTYEAIRSQIDVASELSEENPILIFHPGFCNIKSTREQAIENIINNIKPHLDYAASKKVIITLENMDYKPEGKMIFHDYHDFETLFNKIDHPNLKITMDWGHLNTNTQNEKYINKYGREGLQNFNHISDFIEKLNKKIIHAHVHYNKSHLFKDIEKKKNYVKDIVFSIFFWTDIVKFLNSGNVGISVYDKHLPFNKISSDYLVKFKRTIGELLDKSSIKDHGIITHEISPKKIFKYFTFMEEGAGYNDLIKSLNIFKNFINESN